MSVWRRVLVVAISTTASNGFQPVSLARRKRRSNALLVLGSEPSASDQQHAQGAPVSRLKHERRELEAVLHTIVDLEISLDESSLEAVTMLEDTVANVADRITELSRTLIPPVGLGMDDYVAGIRAFIRLPLSVRVILCQAVGMEDPLQSATDWDEAPVVVATLYQDRQTLTSWRLKNAVETVQQLDVKATGKRTEDRLRGLESFFVETEDLSEFDGGDMNKILGRVTRQEDRLPTKQDLRAVLSVLGPDSFVSNNNERIPSGYVVYGRRNEKLSTTEILDVLDQKLPKEWSAQVCLLPDFINDIADRDKECLLVLSKDLSPLTSGWIFSLTSVAAVISTILFTLGLYGSNDLVADKLIERTAVGDYDGFGWFNLKVLAVILPLAVTQAVHEAGHWMIVWRDKLRITLPTLIPFWPLPFMGTKTSFKESPPSLTSLFDFAIMGPFLGILTSLAFLFVGLQATGTADAETLQYFPALPARVLQSSTLGGTIVDNFFGGNYLSMQDPKAAISLHPFAIAGLLSLQINALELLPQSSTDGGRMSLSVFGRSVNEVVGGVTWVALLCTALLVEGADALTGAWIVHGLIQSDTEVPCRNEVDEIDLTRGAAAFLLWFFAALTLVPMIR